MFIMSTSEGDGSEDISGPLVFSCAKCRTIVGDSFSFLSSNESMQTITLTASSNIQRSADVYTSKSGSDVGSTYFSFTCNNCQCTLGRYYLTTSKDLDDLREKFTFNVNYVSSYELGTSQHGKMPDPIEDGSDKTDKKSVSNNNEDDSALSKTRNDVNGLNEEVLKVQTVLVGVLERIETLENHVLSNERSSPAHHMGGHKRKER